MAVAFDPPPALVLRGSGDSSTRTWPLPPVYLAGIGTLVVAFGHLETFEKMLAHRLSGAREDFGRLVLGGMRATDIREIVKKLVHASDEFKFYAEEILLLNRAAGKLQQERNDIVHKAWFQLDGRLVVTDELTAKNKPSAVVKEYSVERIYEIGEAATLVGFRVGAYLTEEVDRASALKFARNAYPLPAWLQEMAR